MPITCTVYVRHCAFCYDPYSLYVCVVLALDLPQSHQSRVKESANDDEKKNCSVSGKAREKRIVCGVKSFSRENSLALVHIFKRWVINMIPGQQKQQQQYRTTEQVYKVNHRINLKQSDIIKYPLSTHYGWLCALCIVPSWYCHSNSLKMSVFFPLLLAHSI